MNDAHASLPDDNRIARCCKPSSVSAAKMPMATAFALRREDAYLSVNWLEYFGTADVGAAIDALRCVSRRKGYQVRPNGRFAILGVGSAKTAGLASLGRKLRIERQPLPEDPSHSGIHGYTANDLAVQIELQALVSRQDVYPGVA